MNHCSQYNGAFIFFIDLFVPIFIDCDWRFAGLIGSRWNRVQGWGGMATLGPSFARSWDNQQQQEYKN